MFYFFFERFWVEKKWGGNKQGVSSVEGLGVWKVYEKNEFFFLIRRDETNLNVKRSVIWCEAHILQTKPVELVLLGLPWKGAFDSAKNHKRQRRKRQSS